MGTSVKCLKNLPDTLALQTSTLPNLAFSHRRGRAGAERLTNSRALKKFNEQRELAASMLDNYGGQDSERNAGGVPVHAEQAMQQIATPPPLPAVPLVKALT